MKSSTPLESVLEYLVVKALSSKFNIIKALRLYFVENISPSRIEVLTGLTKNQVRGYAQRIIEKATDVVRARIYAKYLIPYVEKIKPIMECNGASCRCRICNVDVPDYAVEIHIKNLHSDVVDECVNTIIELLRKKLNKVRS